jgi:hypothetical protein
VAAPATLGLPGLTGILAALLVDVVPAAAMVGAPRAPRTRIAVRVAGS